MGKKSKSGFGLNSGYIKNAANFDTIINKINDNRKNERKIYKQAEKRQQISNEQQIQNEQHLLKDLLLNDTIHFGNYIFKMVNMINYHFNNIFYPILDKQKPFINIAKYDLNKLLKGRSEKELEGIEKNKCDSLKRIVNYGGELDFFTLSFVDVLKKYFENEKNESSFLDTLHFDFLIFFPKKFEEKSDDNKKINDKSKEKIEENEENKETKIEDLIYVKESSKFMKLFNKLVNLRHFIEHPDIKNNCPKFKDLLDIILTFLPDQLVENFYGQLKHISKNIEETIKKYPKEQYIFDKKENEIFGYEEYRNKYKEKYKEVIEFLYSKYLSKSKDEKELDELSSKEKIIKQKHNYRERKAILEGLYKYKDKKTGKHIQCIKSWKKSYNIYKENYEKFFKSKKGDDYQPSHFYKITTFKKIYNFISKKTIEKIEEIINEKAKESNIIQFKYIEDFYFTNIKINFLLDKQLDILMDKQPDLLDDNKKFKDKDLKDIRNAIAHKHLFSFKENNELKSSKTIDAIPDLLKATTTISNFLNKIQNTTEKHTKYYNEFITNLEAILFDLKLPYVFNNEENTVKVANTKKLKKYMKFKKYFTIDDKQPIVLLVNSLIKKLKEKFPNTFTYYKNWKI